MASFVAYPCEGLPADRPVHLVAASKSDALGAAASADGSVHVFDDEVSHNDPRGILVIESLTFFVQISMVLVPCCWLRRANKRLLGSNNNARALTP
jgi:hypothetical protein